jgi:MSHA biogenesis protein MshK
MKTAIIFFLGLLAGMSSASAQEGASLPDPTRPPGVLSGGGVEGGAEAGLRLQSVLTKGDRPMAIISGQVVRVGEKVGEARLVRVTENEAVLRGPGGVERLFLVSDVSKKYVVQKAAVKENEKRKKP